MPSRRHSRQTFPVPLPIDPLIPVRFRHPVGSDHTRRRLRPAAVVRQRRHVLDRLQLDARADSRPEPGPRTRTSSSCTPIFLIFSEIFSAARCAAHGVLLRLPLVADRAGRSQAITCPARSVIDDRVVERRLHVGIGLADVLACALLWLCCFGHLGLTSLLVAIFLPATVFRGPFRVRALERVRWPRTGRPRRWRSPR